MNRLKERVSAAYAGIQTFDVSALATEYLRYVKSTRSIHTYTTRVTHINQFVSFCTEYEITDMRKLNTQVVDIYLDEYRTSHKLSTVGATKQIIKSFITWVEHYKEVDTRVITNALQLVKQPRRLPKYIDGLVIEKVCTSPYTSPQARLMVMLMAQTGVRISELLKIKPKDFDGEYIHIIGKGDIERSVYVPVSLMEFISSYRSMFQISDDDYLIQGKRGVMPINTAWYKIKTSFITAADYPMNPHQLRHSYAISLLIAGCDVVTIQKALGHSDLKTTMIYLNISDEIMKNQLKRYLG